MFFRCVLLACLLVFGGGQTVYASGDTTLSLRIFHSIGSPYVDYVRLCNERDMRRIQQLLEHFDEKEAEQDALTNLAIMSSYTDKQNSVTHFLRVTIELKIQSFKIRRTLRQMERFLDWIKDEGIWTNPTELWGTRQQLRELRRYFEDVDKTITDRIDTVLMPELPHLGKF